MASRSVLFFQHGDYAWAYRRLGEGAEETYRDQRRSVDFVAGLTERLRVGVVSFTEAAYDAELAPGLRASGVRMDELTPARLSALFDAHDPELVVCRCPHPQLLREAGRRGLTVLPCFADIFVNSGPRALYRNLRLRRALTGVRSPGLANHSLNASRSLRSGLFFSEDRIVPWDWSRLAMAGPAKSGPAAAGRLSVLFAGGLSAAKGVGDCLEALAELTRQGREAEFVFAGPGDVGFWQAEAARLGVQDRARFLDRVPNAEVRRRMREIDVVVVPSRHSYAEGLPNTIYEGLASRSPLLISDHPAFRGRLKPDEECLIFEASNPGALVRALIRLGEDPALYRRLSGNAEQALDGLYVGMEWSRLIEAFVEDPGDRGGWVEANSLRTLGI